MRRNNQGRPRLGRGVSHGELFFNDLRAGSSSPAHGRLPPRRLISLSNALKSARALRLAKYSAVCNAEIFSATAVATNWLMLVPSSLLCCSTAFFSERGNRST
jgi:hypothetical protein